VPVCPKATGVRLLMVNNAVVNSKSRNFIAKLRFSARGGPVSQLYALAQLVFRTIP
jgi:hypothetical protein